MTRRNFLSLAAASVSAQTRRPNFIVIFADDLGYGDLSCFGATGYKTPNLDRMAAEGIRLTDFYVPLPFCAPSRSSLLTGRYPFRTTITRNPTPDAGINDYGLPAEEVTIAEMLKPLGYRTCCIGKWHLGHLPKFLPRTQGFDEYFGIPYSNDMRPVQLVHNETVVQYPVPQVNLTRDYTKRAIDFIAANKSRPFFLYLPHTMPHKPLAASEDFYKPGGTSKDLYASVVTELDHHIGQLLAAVKANALDDNTLVIFTSDNGPWFGGSTAGLRGMKGTSFEGGIRVPGIARWPGKIPPGQTSDAIAGVIDILPTIAAAAGAKLPGRTIDGRNLMPLLTGVAKQSPHEALFAMSNDVLVSIRSGKWRLHVRQPVARMLGNIDAAQWVDPRAPDGVTILAPIEQARPNEFPGVDTGARPKPMMLFDLENDRSEQRDVAAENPEVVQRLKALFDKMEAEVKPINQPRPQPLRRVKGGSLNYEK